MLIEISRTKISFAKTQHLIYIKLKKKKRRSNNDNLMSSGFTLDCNLAGKGGGGGRRRRKRETHRHLREERENRFLRNNKCVYAVQRDMERYPLMFIFKACLEGG